VSLSGEDVRAVDAAVLAQIPQEWIDAAGVVSRAHASLLSKYPSVPEGFFSYRLRKLVAANAAEASGLVDRQLNYQVRSVCHAPAA
jgi:hypothetical protein